MLASRVFDASVLVAVLVRADAGAEVGRRELSSSIPASPHGVDLEVLHALRGRWLGGKLSADRLELSARALGSLPVARYPVHRLAGRILELRHNLTAYDASYVALAESLDAELVTFDRGMAAVPGARCRIRLLER